MNYSYKRYWEPSTTEVLASSLTFGALTTAIVYPLDFLKTRIQIRADGIGVRNYNLSGGINPFKVFREIHQTGGGFSQFYHGLDAALYGRLSYLFIRNIIYKFTYDRFKPVKAHNDLTTKEKAIIASVAGGFAAFVTNPFDLINLRMMADGGILKKNRRNYASAMDAWGKIQSTEGGTRALFKGSTINVIRAILLNISLTGPYDYLNEKIWISFGDYGGRREAALLWAGFWASIITLPFDNVRTKLMKQFDDNTKNRITYANIRDCFAKTVEIEGLSGFYVGFYTHWYRCVAYCLLTVYATDLFTEPRKKEAGLKEWQI